jgi:hypothetical protein
LKSSACSHCGKLLDSKHVCAPEVDRVAVAQAGAYCLLDRVDRARIIGWWQHGHVDPLEFLESLGLALEVDVTRPLHIWGTFHPNGTVDISRTPAEGAVPITYLEV